MCRSSSVSALPHSSHWVCLRQATLYSLSYAGSCDETLISFVGLSPDSAVKRMSSKFVFRPPPERTLTRAGCSSVRQKLGCSYPTQGVEIRVDSFLLGGCSVRPEMAWGILPNVFDFLYTRLLQCEAIERKVWELWCAVLQPTRACEETGRRSGLCIWL